MNALAQIALIALGFLLIYLKVSGSITLSWVWVLAPFWAGAAFAVIIFIVALIVALAVKP